MAKWKSRLLLAAVGGDWQPAVRISGGGGDAGLGPGGRGERGVWGWLGWVGRIGTGDGGCWRRLAVLATLSMHALLAMRADLAGLSVSARRGRAGTGSVRVSERAGGSTVRASS